MKNISLKTAIICYCLLASIQMSAQKNSYLIQYRNKVIDYNQDIKNAQYNIYIKQEKEKSAKADFLPSLSSDANFNFIGNPTDLTLSMPHLENPIHFEGCNTQYGVSLTLAQPIYAGGAIKASYEISKKETDIAKYEQKLITDNILYNADVYYWNTVARNEMITVVSDYLTSITELVNVINNRVEEGFTDRADLLMAEVKLNDAKYQLIQAENEAEKARLALNSYSGTPAEVIIETDKSVPPITVPYKMEKSVACMAEQQSEVKIAHSKMDIQTSAAKIANSQFLPKLSVGISGNYTAPGYDFKSDPNPNYAVYTKLSIPVFDWGKRRNTRRTGKYNVTIMKENISKVTDRIQLEINTALYDCSQAIKKIELTMNSLEKAAENEKRTIEKYNEGNISIIEVINAQLYHQEARVNYIQSKLNAQIATSHLKRVTGENYNG